MLLDEAAEGKLLPVGEGTSRNELEGETARRPDKCRVNQHAGTDLRDGEEESSPCPVALDFRCALVESGGPISLILELDLRIAAPAEVDGYELVLGPPTAAEREGFPSIYPDDDDMLLRFSSPSCCRSSVSRPLPTAPTRLFSSASFLFSRRSACRSLVRSLTLALALGTTAEAATAAAPVLAVLLLAPCAADRSESVRLLYAGTLSALEVC